ncbi:MAG: hypothetical protein E7256_07865 [Lachnospiraceae bacterium]|nr:hypothetical protein [Lachnospiraceae bacterium]
MKVENSEGKANEKTGGKGKWRCQWIFAVLAFAITFYLVEFSPWSSRMVAEYNNGYGTFDMKQYNRESVEEVLTNMEEEGFTAYNHYLAVDTVFILAFGWLQILMARAAGEKGRSIFIKRAGMGAAVARGAFDLVENITLFHILREYPNMSAVRSKIAGTATRFKLACIGVWIVLLVAGMILAKRRGQKKIRIQKNPA